MSRPRIARLIAPLAGVAVLLALAAVGTLGCGRSTPAVDPERFFACADCNVIMVSLDTLRADRLGAYGYGRPTSPHMDRFAAESVVFRDVLAQAPSTASSHRSLFMGLYVSEHRNGEVQAPTLAEVLGGAGYRTAAFVDGGKMSRGFGLDRGFEVYEESGRPVQIFKGPTAGLPVLLPKALAWLGEHRREKFFLFLHTYEVHCPYTPPEPWRTQFTDGYEARFDTTGLCRDEQFRKLGLTPRETQYVSDLYDAEVRTLDEQLAELFTALQEMDLLERSVVILTSDHGESLGERGKIGHNEVYDVQLKVPLIVRLPAARGVEVTAPAQLIDVMPTVLRLVGVEHGLKLTGRDLAPFVYGRTVTERLRLAETGRLTARSIRLDTRWSLVAANGRPRALYDLAADPDETDDRLDQEPRIAARLWGELGRLGFGWRRSNEIPQQLSPELEQQLRALGYVGN